MKNLYFNILTFNHPNSNQTFYFTNSEQPNLTRIYKTLVPDEVIETYGEQEHYFTSFTQNLEGFLPVTKPVTLNFEKKKNKTGEEKSVPIHNSAFSSSV